MMRMTAGAMIAGAFLTVAGSAALAQSGSATIDAIVKRGEVNCGVAGNSPMFSLPDSQGVMRGLDADFCRSVAAAILGDAKKVKFIPTTAQNRFTALQAGEVDLLYRSTTWTMAREANLGTLFASVNFYDGTGFLVKKSLGVKVAKEMDGASVCVAPGTSTELAVSDFFREHKIKFTPIIIADVNEIRTPISPAAATPMPMTPRASPASASSRAPRQPTTSCCPTSSPRSRSAPRPTRLLGGIIASGLPEINSMSC